MCLTNDWGKLSFLLRQETNSGLRLVLHLQLCLIAFVPKKVKSSMRTPLKWHMRRTHKMISDTCAVYYWSSLLLVLMQYLFFRYGPRNPQTNCMTRCYLTNKNSEFVPAWVGYIHRAGTRREIFFFFLHFPYFCSVCKTTTSHIQEPWRLISGIKYKK